jgi:transposase, IS5 family
MRNIIHKQLPIVASFIEHEHARELGAMSEILDSIGTEILEMVHADLVRGVSNPDKGRIGMSAEQVVRAVVIKQMNGFSYERLEFHLADSTSYRTFCRYGLMDKTPDISTLKRNIKRLRPETMEAINRQLLGYASEHGIEDGRKVRTDCTVEETNIHEPKDSWLLYDCVRVLTRLLGRAKEELSARIVYTDHERRAKRRFRNIEHTGDEKRRIALYRDLLKIAEKTVRYAALAAPVLQEYRTASVLKGAQATGIAAQLREVSGYAIQVINQATRRVLYSEQVPAAEKLVSIFEPHTDIIIKDRRDTLFGHKICLSSGASSLIFDCLILEGNPVDSSLPVQMMKRHKRIWGCAPQQASYDGGFASGPNLEAIKELGVTDVAFNKKRGLEVSEMTRSSWIYRSLSYFRAGIEGGISFLKRCFGLARCMWKGFESFRAYTWASIISHNLLILSRHRLS